MTSFADDRSIRIQGPKGQRCSHLENLENEGLTPVRVKSLLLAAINQNDSSLFDLSTAEFRQRMEEVLQEQDQSSGNVGKISGHFNRKLNEEDTGEGAVGIGRGY